MVNKVFLIGNLGNDPDVRTVAGDTAMAKCNLATNKRWKTKSGEQQEETQ